MKQLIRSQVAEFMGKETDVKKDSLMSGLSRRTTYVYRGDIDGTCAELRKFLRELKFFYFKADLGEG